MADATLLLLALLAGGALGAMFFGGLWWTVRRGALSPSPARWFIGSLLVRTGLALAGFCLVGLGQPTRLLACLLGFVVARMAITRWSGRVAAGRPATATEARHAP